MFLTMNASIQKSANPTIQCSSHFWRVEPVTDIDPQLARKRPKFSVQYLFCLRATDQPVGLIRRIPPARCRIGCLGPIRTAWCSGDQIETKNHYTLQGAKKFLERKFTRTVPRRP